MFDLSNRDIIFYGVTFQTEAFHYQLCRQGQEKCIKGIVDGFFSGTFRGFEVKGPEQLKNLFVPGDIIVIMGDHSYDTISRILNELGYREWRDYIGRRYLGKKLVTVNTNCYGFSIIHHLEQSEKFRRQYVIAPVPPVFLNKDGNIHPAILEATDLYIHQDIQSSNQFGYKLSDEYVLPRLREDCVRFCVPNLVGMFCFLFPTQSGGGYSLFQKAENGLRYMKDALIEEAYEKTAGAGNRLDAILAYIDAQTFDRMELRALYDDSLRKIREREKNWDVKWSHVMEQAMGLEHFAVDRDHPSPEFVRRICEEVAMKFGIDDIPMATPKEIYCVGHEAPVWKQVREVFPEKGYTVSCPSILGQGEYEVDTREYIREYVWYVYEDYLE